MQGICITTPTSNVTESNLLKNIVKTETWSHLYFSLLNTIIHEGNPYLVKKCLHMHEKICEALHQTISDPVLSMQGFLKKDLERKLLLLFSQNVNRIEKVLT